MASTWAENNSGQRAEAERLEFDRVAMHAVRRRLLEAQADAAGVPLRTVPLPWPCSNEQYEERMRAADKT